MTELQTLITLLALTVVIGIAIFFAVVIQSRLKKAKKKAYLNTLLGTVYPSAVRTTKTTKDTK